MALDLRNKFKKISHGGTETVGKPGKRFARRHDINKVHGEEKEETRKTNKVKNDKFFPAVKGN